MYFHVEHQELQGWALEAKIKAAQAQAKAKQTRIKAWRVAMQDADKSPQRAYKWLKGPRPPALTTTSTAEGGTGFPPACDRGALYDGLGGAVAGAGISAGGVEPGSP